MRSDNPSPRRSHERQAIVDRELGAFVREIVPRLNDEDLEHHDRIERRTPALRAIGIRQHRVQVSAEYLEIHHCTERLAQPPKRSLASKNHG